MVMKRTKTRVVVLIARTIIDYRTTEFRVFKVDLRTGNEWSYKAYGTMLCSWGTSLLSLFKPPNSKELDLIVSISRTIVNQYTSGSNEEE